MVLLALSCVAWGQSEVDWGSCRSYCSPTEIGNTLIEVHLPEGDTGPSPAAGGGTRRGLASRPDALDVTTYEDGFSRGRAITLPLFNAAPAARRAEGSFSTSRSLQPKRPDAPAPGLESISVRSVTQETSTSPLSLPRAAVAPGSQPPAAPAGSLVTLDQAEPGRTYFIRPAASTADALACQAAICPMDLVSPARPAPRRPR